MQRLVHVLLGFFALRILGLLGFLGLLLLHFLLRFRLEAGDFSPVTGFERLLSGPMLNLVACQLSSGHLLLGFSDVLSHGCIYRHLFDHGGGGGLSLTCGRSSIFERLRARADLRKEGGGHIVNHRLESIEEVAADFRCRVC